MQGSQTPGQDGQVPLVEPRFNLLGDEPDGSLYEIDYNPQPEAPLEPPVNNFYANLAEDLSPQELDGLTELLIEEIEDDDESRSEWMQSNTQAMEYLGFKIEQFVQSPFANACGAYDTTLAVALLNYYADASAEIFPAKGPAKSEVYGEITEERQMQADTVCDYMNHYLTRVDTGYYPDSKRLLMYTGLLGSCFRKTYIDPILERPLSRMVQPQDFIVDANAPSITVASRLTEKVYLSRQEVVLREQQNDFMYCDLPNTNEDNEDELSPMDEQIDQIQGIDKQGAVNKNYFTFYECHTTRRIDNVDMEIDPKLPLPYLVTICLTSRKIVSIRRNWREGDKDYKRKNVFTQFNYHPGFGIYGIGLAQLVVSSSIVLTAILRTQVNAALMSLHPGGLAKKGLKLENNDKAVGLGEFIPIETGDMPIQQCVMPMPYAGPNPVLLELAKEIRQNVLALPGSAEKAISEMNPNAAATTTIALLEVQTRMQSAVLMNLHNSVGNELQMMFDLFAENMSDDEYLFDMPGKEGKILKSYFNPNVGIIPVSDPTLITNTQRLMRMEALYKLSNAAPQLHNMREIYRRMYVVMGIEKIDEILLPEPQKIPLDPVTENTYIMQGKAVEAFLDQDHDAHMIVLEDPILQSTPQTAAAAAAHKQQHMSMKYIVEMQAQMGGPMPPIEEISKNIQLQNQIAVMGAQITLQKVEEMKKQQQDQQPPNPTQVMLMDIEQREKAAQLKLEEAKLRAETESYKSTMNFETEKMKLDAQKEIADDKNETGLSIARLKQFFQRKPSNDRRNP